MFKIKLLKLNIHIAATYRPPDCPAKEFTDNFSTYINKYKSILFFGDFNFNLLDKVSDDVKYFINTVYSEGLVILNNEDTKFATRVTSHSATTIDLIITDLVEYKYKLDVDNICVSDHKLLMMNLDLNVIQNISSLQIHRIDYNKMKNDIRIRLNSNKPKSFDELMQIITESKEQNKTTFTKTIKHKKYYQEWSTQELKNIVKKRKAHFDLHKKFPNNLYYLNKYKETKIESARIANESKKHFYSKKFEENIGNSRKVWIHINELIFNKQIESNNKLPKVIEYKEQVYDSKNEICNILNSYFGDIGEIIGINDDFSEHVDEIEDDMNEELCFEFLPTSLEEIQYIIHNLNSDSASGYDCISAKLLKNVLEEISPCLVDLINDCLNRGVFPDELKIAKVTLIHKNGKKEDPNNYRPISILPTISKIFETIIKNRMSDYLEKTNFIDKNQFGFQKKSNTSAATTNLIENIYENIDKKLKTACIFIDVRKAFDSVDHSILIKKLKKTGFRNKAINLISKQ